MTAPAFIVEDETADDGVLWHCDAVDGLPLAIDFEGRRPETYLIAIKGLRSAVGPVTLRPDHLCRISKTIDGIDVEVGYIVSRRLLSQKDATQHHLAMVCSSHLLRLLILEAWAAGAKPDWRDLAPAYRCPWLSACMTLAGPANWRQALSSTNVVIDPQGMDTEDDFWCYLGEALFGYRGYAGTNPGALVDVLRSNPLRHVTLRIPDETKLAQMLARATKRPDFLAVFKEIAQEAGARIRTG